MVLKDIDSSKLLFDLSEVDLVEKVRLKFPEFNEYKGTIDPIKVCQYIILMSDMQSPMRIEKPDLYQRKFTVAHMVKMPMAKKQFSEEAEDIILGANDAVNETMVAYIMSYGLPNYTLLMAFTYLLSFETQKILAGKGNKDSQRVIDNASDRIQTLTRDFFKSGNYDEYSSLRQVLYAKIEKERLRLRPEQIVRALENDGALPEDFNPYGDYNIDLSKALTFMGDK